MLMCLVLSFYPKLSRSYDDNYSVLEKGVRDGLHPCIPVMFTRSYTYYSHVSDNNTVALMAKRGKSSSYEGEEDAADTEYHEQFFCYIDVLKGGVIPIQIWPF
jgi:hypothetical protein